MQVKIFNVIDPLEGEKEINKFLSERPECEVFFVGQSVLDGEIVITVFYAQVDVKY